LSKYIPGDCWCYSIDCWLFGEAVKEWTAAHPPEKGGFLYSEEELEELMAFVRGR
jgi:hypothetical protein